MGTIDGFRNRVTDHLLQDQTITISIASSGVYSFGASNKSAPFSKNKCRYFQYIALVAVC